MGAMTDTVQRVFDALDRSDAEAAIAVITDDAQGIDEDLRADGYVSEMR